MMKSMRTFENNLYMKAFRWAYNLLIFNVLFTLLNLPLFLAFNLLAVDPRNTLFFLVALLPFGGAFAALLGSLEQFSLDKECEPVTVFFNQIRSFWLKGTAYWLVTLACLIVIFTDLLFFSATPWFQWISPLLFIVGVIGLGVFLNSSYFQIRNPLASSKDIYKISFFYTLKKWYLTGLNGLLLVAILGCMLLKPQLGYLLAPSLLGGLIYLNSRHLYKVKAVDPMERHP
ncbi:DUF624 domain-containing protein [Candidatus Enterococcus clewellii]|uniref:DUF624 domain-containing protein n=1 Tax=Candidatus Enterococcus clewellii TaxID=1834193 RepID=A0A242KB81_9ENTE|nr:DUF624 domain-containing protein [Enterococcus sp. 9E7_DIV0242]OTP18329.1 hypothetical protein A5888_000143 [Enterococcus sp. 9E7_DIV0242]